MIIDGVSQSTGVERLVEVTADGSSVRLSIRNRVGGGEPAALTFVADELMTVLSDQPEGPQQIAGGDGQVLTVEVRRNEVQLALGATDAAVGLDDLMDALAGALPSS